MTTRAGILCLMLLGGVGHPMVAGETAEPASLTLSEFGGAGIPDPSFTKQHLLFVPQANRIFKSIWPGVTRGFEKPLETYNSLSRSTRSWADADTGPGRVIREMFEVAAPGQKLPSLPKIERTAPAQLDKVPEPVREIVREVCGIAQLHHVFLRNRFSGKAWAPFTQGKNLVSEILPRAVSSFSPHNAAGGIMPASVGTVSAVPLLRLVRSAEHAADALTALARKHAASPKFAGITFDPVVMDTPYGRIVVTDSRSTTIPDGDIHIDLGGDDTYARAGRTISLDNPVSLCLDLGGNDTYGSKDGPGCARGSFGLGLIVDAAGNDTHHGHDGGMGCGIFGAGVLIDIKGNDRYLGDRGYWLQGAACGGLGLLLDCAGDDTYRCADESQGFGGPRGIGLLLDRAGKDDYEATSHGKVTKDYGKNPVNMSQGCAYGKRHPKYFLAGGIGLLVDGAGDDRYMSRTWGQGAGYFYGLGFLHDLDGNDSFQSTQYSQGSAAHQAIGFFRESAGNDRYNQSIPEGKPSRRHFGTGRDISVGIFVDDAGNDSYAATHVSFGYGDDNGVGLFLDRSGNDTYMAPPDRPLFHGFGQARRPADHPPAFRKKLHTMGLFRDLSGKDTFADEGKRKEFPPKKDGKWSVTDGERALFGRGSDE